MFNVTQKLPILVSPSYDEFAFSASNLCFKRNGCTSTGGFMRIDGLNHIGSCSEGTHLHKSVPYKLLLFLHYSFLYDLVHQSKKGFEITKTGFLSPKTGFKVRKKPVLRSPKQVWDHKNRFLSPKTGFKVPKNRLYNRQNRFLDRQNRFWDHQNRFWHRKNRYSIGQYWLWDQFYCRENLFWRSLNRFWRSQNRLW